MTIDNFIFDWSGTLSDDRRPVYEANMKIFPVFGIKKMKYKNWLSTTTMTVVDYFNLRKIKANPARIFSEYKKAYEEVNNKGIMPKIYPQAKKLLQTLYKKDKKIIIISSHPQEKLEEEIKRYDVLKYIDEIIGSVHNKVLVIKQEIKKEKLIPEKTIYIGDMVFDIRSTKEAGIISGAIGHGYHPSKRLKKEKPDYYFNNLEKILKII